MSNINVNRNTADPSDNVIRRYTPQKTDPRHYSLAVIMITATAFAIDLVFWILMKVECYWSCGDMVTVWYVWTGVIAIGAIAGVCIGLYNWLRNSAFLDVASIKMHRGDIRSYAPSLVQNDSIRAHSEATSGIDTWSPSVHYSNTGMKDTTPALPVELPRLPSATTSGMFESLYNTRQINNSNQSVLVGFDSNEQGNHVQLDTNPTIAIMGKSRQGKSNTAEFILSQLALAGNGLFIADMAGEHEQALLHRVQHLQASILGTAGDYDAAVKMISDVASIGESRAAGKSADRRPLFLVIDEFTRFIDGLDRRTKDSVVSTLRNFANAYGKYNVRLMLIGHNVNHDLFGDAAFRRSITAKVMHRLDEDEAKMLTHNTKLSKSVAELTQGHVIIESVDGVSSMLRVPEMTTDDRTFIKRTLRPSTKPVEMWSAVETDAFLAEMLNKYTNKQDAEKSPQVTTSEQTNIQTRDDLIRLLRSQGWTVSRIRALLKGDFTEISRVYNGE